MTTFDPLVDLDGLWTTALAERYLPIPGVPAAKYHCLEGRLYINSNGPAANSCGVVSLAALAHQAVAGTRFRLYGTVNLAFTPGSWIQTNLTVLNRSAGDAVWVEPGMVTMVVDLMGPSRIDKRDLCAQAGIPYFMEVEVSPRPGVRLLELGETGYEERASAIAGHLFETDLPFPMSFDPIELLDL